MVLAAHDANLSANALQVEHVVMIDPAKTRDNPYQPRTVRDAVADAELDMSVASIGVTQPIVTLRSDRHGIRTVVAGHRRRDSARNCGQLCPAIERDYIDDEFEAMSAIENIQRQNMTLVDEVGVVARMAAKHGNKETARMLGKSAGYVSKAVRINQADGAIASLLHAGHSNDAAAFYELALLQSKAPAAAEKIARHWQEKPDQRVSLRARIAEAKAVLVVATDENTWSPSPGVPGKARRTKVLALGFTPETFHMETEPSGQIHVVFTLNDGGTVTVEFSEDQWKAFTAVVNGRTR